MQRIKPTRSYALHDIAHTRRIEQEALTQGIPLMERAGLRVAQLSLALAPHAQTFWVACGPGNNGGDGRIAARHLQQWGKDVIVTSAEEPPPAAFDFVIDALLGVGTSRAPEGALANLIDYINASGQPVLAIDVPSGLNANTGALWGEHAVKASTTLSLLTLKPGLWTGQGRDYAGDIWWDDLDWEHTYAPQAWLSGPNMAAPRLHDSHKGSYGDVAIIGGAPGFSGAAVLAARAALHGGAGRVMVHLLTPGQTLPDAELMPREFDALDLTNTTVVCGCGGGDAIASRLPAVLNQSAQLVLDADALNAIAIQPTLQTLLQARQSPTVLTPHPLEAARLLQTTTAEVQTNRPHAAQTLAQRWNCIVVLKGSGSVIAEPYNVASINPTGNARLATAGTGDVLAGLIGAMLARRDTDTPLFERVCAAVFHHGQTAETTQLGHHLTADTLARAL